MTTFFVNYLDDLFEEATNEVVGQIGIAEAKASAEGYLRSGRIWVEREEIWLDAVTKYAQKLIDVLLEHEIEHSPVKVSDFDSYLDSLRKFKQFCENSHKERRDNKAFVYPQTRPAFDNGKMERRARLAEQLIIGAKKTFASKRSFIKWAVGDTRRRIFSLISSAVLLGLGAFLEGKFAILKSLLSVNFQ